MGNTARLALPYPEDTDPLANMAAAVEALANALDIVVDEAGDTTGITASSSATSTSLTVASTTITAPGGIPYELSFSWYNVIKSVATDVFLVQIREGATVLATFLLNTTNVNGGSGYVRTVLVPATGNHTYDAVLTRSSGTGTGTLSATTSTPAVAISRAARGLT